MSPEDGAGKQRPKSKRAIARFGVMALVNASILALSVTSPSSADTNAGADNGDQRNYCGVVAIGSHCASYDSTGVVTVGIDFGRDEAVRSD
jgi:hypothetical protein